MYHNSVAALLVVFAFYMFRATEGQQSWLGDCPQSCECEEWYIDSGVSRANLVVNCRSRNLEGVPAGVPEKTSILDLYNNNIDILSSDILVGNYSNIHRLNLARNKLSTIESGIFNNVPHLRELVFSGEYIHELNSEILSGIGELEQFICFGCTGINELTNGIFANIPNLRYMLFRNGSISEIGNDVFSDVTALFYLDLSYNQLKEIPDLSHLSQLNTIHLQGNMIKRIEGDRIGDLSQTTLLDLRDNRLTALNTDAVDVLDSYNPSSELRILVDGNPWRCDCDLKPVLDKWPTMPWILKDTIICKSPRKFRGMNLWDIPPTELCDEEEDPGNGGDGDDGDDEIQLGIIIGAAAGSVAGTLIIALPIVILVLCCRKRR
ncbi:trophoblast glycoprotein-like [Glandiceps talaboti]